MIREYRALRSLARRYGWSGSDDEWPARPETIGLHRDREQRPPSAPELPDAATVLIERASTAKPESAADGFQTAVIRKRAPETW